MPTLASVSPAERKLRYIESITTPSTIDLILAKWAFQLPKIFANSSWNIYLKLFLDLDLLLDFHFDWTSFQFPNPEFQFDIPYFTFPEPTPDIKRVDKAKYGVSKYNESIYDPTQVTSFNLENAIWDLRYKATEPCDLAWKSTSLTLKNHFDTMRDILVKKDIREEYVDGILNLWAVIEGKALSTTYVGFAIVDMVKVGEKPGSVSHFDFRSPVDWETPLKFETYSLCESFVGVALVGFSRVISKEYGISRDYLLKLSNYLVEAVEAFHRHVGRMEITVPMPVFSSPPEFTFPLNYQRVHWLRTSKKMHWRGSEHQLKLQRVINRTKSVLNDAGVPGTLRLMYISFVEELMYLSHGEDTRWKEWKKCLTEDDLIEKYKNMGAESHILNSIKGYAK